MNAYPHGTLLLGGAISVLLALGCQDQPSANPVAVNGLMQTSLASQPASRSTMSLTKGQVDAALEHSQRSGRYLYVLLKKADDGSTKAMRKVFQAFIESAADKADAIEATVTAVSERRFVNEYGLSRAPMPLVLAFAPNGAATGGFHTNFTVEELASGMVSPTAADCMKLLQDGKLVVLCIQNPATRDNDAARAGAEAFVSDPNYRDAVRIVSIDPSSPAEHAFLTQLEVTPTSPTAVTVLLAPPGAPIAKFEGATTKDAFVEAITKASSSCCPGGVCGPDGCQPK